jgi:hypothetical protein
VGEVSRVVQVVETPEQHVCDMSDLTNREAYSLNQRRSLYTSVPDLPQFVEIGSIEGEDQEGEFDISNLLMEPLKELPNGCTASCVTDVLQCLRLGLGLISGDHLE